MSLSPAFTSTPPLSPAHQCRREQVLHLAEKRGWLVAPRAAQVVESCHAAWKAGFLPEVEPIPSPTASASSKSCSTTSSFSASESVCSSTLDIDKICDDLKSMRVQAIGEITTQRTETLHRSTAEKQANELSKKRFASKFFINDEAVDENEQPLQSNHVRLKHFGDWLNTGAFVKTREQSAIKLLRLFDAEVMDGALLRCKINGVSRVSLAWSSRLYKTAGITYMKQKSSSGERTASIELSLKVVDEPARLYNTLAHELCHAATWIIDNCSKPPHGSVFKSWAKRFREWDPNLNITTCHDYAIRYKFNYVCVSCGQCYGRHSKSIDTVKKVCGSCKGALKLRTT